MSVWIHRIETIVPDFSFTQEQASTKMQEWSRDERERRIIRMIYRQSGIERRHSVITNFDGEGEDSFFKAGMDGLRLGPGTADRNGIYERESRRLSVELARRALPSASSPGPSDVTHVVTVSCTGFCNPGPDYHIVRELGLPPSTQRYHLGFMGCYAALPGLRMAKQFCEADPRAVVLVLCLELCSLHLHLNGSEDTLLANSLFADGAAAAVVSAREPAPGSGAYRLGEFFSAIVPAGEADMAWRIGDRGFDIALSSYVPKLIGANIRGFIEPSLSSGGFSLRDIATWAVHPGGKSIIDQVQSNLGLGPLQVGASREVLRRYGNMSSATILFVLKEILSRTGTGEGGGNVCAVAFGPGLTVELALLEARSVAAGAGSAAHALAGVPS